MVPSARSTRAPRCPARDRRPPAPVRLPIRRAMPCRLPRRARQTRCQHISAAVPPRKAPAPA
eukprot:12902339-Heterocapsa_arctica.AAC.1